MLLLRSHGGEYHANQAFFHVSPVPENISLVGLQRTLPNEEDYFQDRLMHQSIPAVPIPPPRAIVGHFPALSIPGSGISLPSNYPGAFDHPTFFHLTTLSFLLMTISSANTVSFFLNTSRYDINGTLELQNALFLQYKA